MKRRYHLFTAVLVVFTFLLSVTAFAKTTSTEADPLPKKAYFFVGGEYKLSLANAGKKKVTWSSSNKSIATVSKKGKVKAKALGKCYIKVTCNKKTYKSKIIVCSNEKYLKVFCKDFASRIKKAYKSPYDRVIAAELFVSSNLKYGSSSDAADALVKKQGTCVSGNLLLVEMLKTMGYKAELRFAAKDKMSRYPSNVIFYGEHHNVKVKIKGKTYYVDATPATRFVYLSTSKKPIYAATAIFGSWQAYIDKVPGHKNK